MAVRSFRVIRVDVPSQSNAGYRPVFLPPSSHSRPTRERSQLDWSFACRRFRRFEPLCPFYYPNPETHDQLPSFIPESWTYPRIDFPLAHLNIEIYSSLFSMQVVCLPPFSIYCNLFNHIDIEHRLVRTLSNGSKACSVLCYRPESLLSNFVMVKVDLARCISCLS